MCQVHEANDLEDGSPTRAIFVSPQSDDELQSEPQGWEYKHGHEQLWLTNLYSNLRRLFSGNLTERPTRSRGCAYLAFFERQRIDVDEEDLLLVADHDVLWLEVTLH